MADSLALVWDLIARDNASGTFTKVGNAADKASRDAERATGSLSKLHSTLGLIGVAAASIGTFSFLSDTVRLGNSYTQALNQVQAVTGATAQQMAAVRVQAKALGADLTLPATSAADATLAMEELAKGGLNVQQAMDAAKGTLQLAAAAQVDGARAAQIQSNALQTFALSADQAGHVSDVLANAANKSSASIDDMAFALQAGGAVAASLGISIENTSAALGILANSGIKGSDAGTLLKSALLALESPSKQAAEAMDTLGLRAFDAQGNFVGLESLFGQLSDASHRMTQEQYAAATSTLFGSDAARLAAVAAREGATGFATMATAMSTAGTAATIADANMRGLGGAWAGLKSQFENFQLDLYDRAAPGLEKLVRWAAENLPKVGNALIDGIDAGITEIGRLRDKAVADFQAVVDYLQPLITGVQDFARSLFAANGPASIFWSALKIGASAIMALVQAAHPLVVVGGDLLHLFSELPGPLQAVILALGALKVATSLDLFGRLAERGGLGGALGGAGQSVVGFTQTVRTNMRLAGDEVGLLEKTTGGLSAGFQTYFPRASSAVKNFTADVVSSFQQAKQAAQFNVAENFGGGAVSKATGDLAGLGAAARTVATSGFGALKSAGAGLVDFLGGPWGAALAGAGIVFGVLESAIQRAKQVEDAWVEALKAGGKASRDATAEMKQLELGMDGLAQSGTSAGHGIVSFLELIPGIKQGVEGLLPSAGDAKKAFDAWYASLNGTQKAQEDVTLAEAHLQDVMDQYPANSLQVQEASQALNDKREVLRQKTALLNDAEKTHLQLLLDSAAQELASVNSGLAAEQARLGFKIALDQYNKSLADGSLAGDQAAAALNGLAQQAINAAQAAGKAAADQAAANGVTDTATASNQAMLKSLQDTATQMGVNTPQAILALIASLSAATNTSATTTAQMKDLGLTVSTLPDGHTIVIDAPTYDQKLRLQELGYITVTLPDGHVVVYANTDPAVAALQNLIHSYDHYTINLDAAVPGGHLVVGKSSFAAAEGAILSALANGQMAQLFGSGGMFAPMAAGQASIVGPNTWRIIGDRPVGDEAFIPINREPRSVALWQETGRRMGMYADGGFFDSGHHISGTVFANTAAATSGLNDLIGQIRTQLTQQIATAAAPQGVGVERWRSLVVQVLAALGLSSAYANGVLNIIAHESAGNPSAINLWDSNARAGHPSQGLMQTIPGTFAAYAGPYRGLGITNPLANIYAGTNYALHRYGAAWLARGGNATKAGGYMGYDSGGLLPPGWTAAYNGTGKPEHVLTSEQKDALSGPSVFHLYDSDGVLMGTMRGHAEAVAADALTSVNLRGRYNR